MDVSTLHESQDRLKEQQQHLSTIGTVTSVTLTSSSMIPSTTTIVLTATGSTSLSLSIPPRTTETNFKLEPLRGSWKYGHPVFARFQRSTYLYPGNIATYLGGGMFMVVFDDGSLDYRVRREDIYLRELPPRISSPTNPSTSSSSTPEDQEPVDKATQYVVDVSKDPPRPICVTENNLKELKEIRVGEHRLECGITYKEDMTQVSDSDESSEEDMTMTPWQQMTQTFGMGKRTRSKSSRRASPASLSLTSADRRSSSMSLKGINTMLSSPKTLKQSIVEYLGRKTKKVQPAIAGADSILLERIRAMENKQQELKNRVVKYFPPWVGGGGGGGNSTPSSYASIHKETLANNSNNSNSGHSHSSHSSSSTTLRHKSSSHAHQQTSTATTTTTASTSTFHHGSTGVDDSLAAQMPASSRVIFSRDGVRKYGTVKSQMVQGEYEIITEEDNTIRLQVLPEEQVDFLPSLTDLEDLTNDLIRFSKKLYAGKRVQVNLYTGSKFSGNGVVTVEHWEDNSYDLLLATRVHLLHVPADKITPLQEKKNGEVSITEETFLICQGKQKINIGEQILVKCEGEFEEQEQKIGILNGVFSNHTAAVDFADGSTGYQIAPHLISKRRKDVSPIDMDLLSLKNEVLMQASPTKVKEIEVGYQVKADHPRKASVESCVVIKKHPSSACDLRFSDGTIAFEVFPSQMIIDPGSVGGSGNENRSPLPVSHVNVGSYVLGWSSRFARFCSAKVIDKDTAHGLYTIVFDYGEQRSGVSSDKITLIEDTYALSPTQKLTNYSIDTIGFEISPVSFVVGELVMARAFSSVKYFHGRVEHVNEKDRVCKILFDSFERDDKVKFSCMYSIDQRHRYGSMIGHPRLSRAYVSSSGDRPHLAPNEDGQFAGSPQPGGGGALLLDTIQPAPRQRRSSIGSMGSLLMSVAGTLFRVRKDIEKKDRELIERELFGGGEGVEEEGAGDQGDDDEQKPNDEEYQRQLARKCELTQSHHTADDGASVPNIQADRRASA